MSGKLVYWLAWPLTAVGGCVLVDQIGQPPPDNAVQSEVRDFSNASLFRYELTQANAPLDTGTVISLAIQRQDIGEYSLRLISSSAIGGLVPANERLLTGEEQDRMQALFAHVTIITAPIPEACAGAGIYAFYDRVEWDGEASGPSRCDSTTYISSDDWSAIRALLADLAGTPYTLVPY
jgi:hypothetical protein